jgi:hypothetical protein
MKKLTLLIITIIFFSCKTEGQEKIKYADFFGNCLNTREINLLNKGCEIFEKELLKNYENRKIGNSYKEFLEGVQTMRIPRKIFQNNQTSEFLIELEKSNLYNKIWKKYEEENEEEIIIITAPIENQEKKTEKDFYQINENGIYFNCLIEKSENENIKDYLKTIKETPDISPGILVSVLTNKLNEKEFDTGILRLIIAVNFYYELKINLSE